MNINWRDIESRKAAITIGKEVGAPSGIYRLYEKQFNQYSFEETRTVLRHWTQLGSSNDEAFGRVLELFTEATYEDESEKNIEYLCAFIRENVLQKVRNAAQTQIAVSHKLGDRKRSLRKIHTKTRAANRPGIYQHPTQDAVKADEERRGYRGKPYGGLKSLEDEEKKAKTIEECFTSMYIDAIKYEQCDRVIANNERLNARFDFDRAVRESEDIKDTIYQLCEYIDTYDIPFNVRYNAALENITYTMNKNGIHVTNEEMIEQITGYFGMTDFITGDKYTDMYDILKNSVMFTDEECASTLSLFENEEVSDKPDSIYEALNIITEAQKAIDPKKEFEKFKMKPNKDPISFKSLLQRIYANDSTSVVEDMPNIFDILRYGICVGSFAINPVLGIVAFVTDYILKTKYGIKGYEKAIKQYEKEIIRVNKQIKKADSDERKESLKKYKEALMDGRSKLVNELEKLLTEKEKEARAEKGDDYRLYDDGNDDFDFDFDFDFDEAATYIAAFEALEESASPWRNTNLTEMVCEKIHSVTTAEDYNTIAEFVDLCDDVVDRKTVIECFEYEYKNSIENKEYAMIPEINHCIELLKESNTSNDIQFKGVYEIYENTLYKHQAVSDMIEFCTSVNEGSFTEDFEDDIFEDIIEEAANKGMTGLEENPKTTTITKKSPTAKTVDKKGIKDLKNFDAKKAGISARNKLIVTLNNLRRDMEKLSDRERTLSKNVNMAVERIKSNFSRAFTSYNREAVIKGTILPSASTCVKAAIVTGAAWAVNPAIAVIGLLGAIGAAKSSQKKERQLIVDDIDIELAMCEKYMRLAEEKGDMEAIRNIMKTQRELQRQKNKLAYNMQMKFHEKQPTLPSVGQNEAFEYANEMDILNEKFKLKKDIIKDAAEDVTDTAHDASNYVKNKAKQELSTGISNKKKLINKKLTKEDMIKNPNLVKRYIESEEKDPILTLNKLVDVISWCFDTPSAMLLWSIRKVKSILKTIVNVADPRVSVAIKRTRSDCEKYINQLTKEIAKEKDPVKKRELINQRRQLQECLLEVDNKLKDKDMSNIKD